MACAEIPALGIGATYSDALEPLIEGRPELFDVLEIEPQTLWTRNAEPRGPFRLADSIVEHLARLPGRKILHSVGRPVGGTLGPSVADRDLLDDTAKRLDAPWVSDHLSFNHTSEFATGFFLPPRQTPACVEILSSSIRELQETLGLPVAVETGVSYLRPRADELSDGEFVARVVETADCGILLDLHNVYCNAVNGRQSVDEFLDQLPLDRVWEVHLAGGFELEGFYLDAHSGAIPEPLHAVVEDVIPRLPNLKAIIFEIFPSFVPLVGLDVIKDQLEWMHVVWRQLRSKKAGSKKTVTARSETAEIDMVAPAVWERALGRLVVGMAADDQIGVELSGDPGVPLVERLIHEFRASMIVRVLPITSRFIMLAMGPDAFRIMLADFWGRVTPQMYASIEADSFAKYLNALDLKVPHIGKIIEFEQAVMEVNLTGSARVVQFDFEPLPFLRAISEGRLPEGAPVQGNFEIAVTPESSNL